MGLSLDSLIDRLEDIANRSQVIQGELLTASRRRTEKEMLALRSRVDDAYALLTAG